jgi:hypothetical protein
MTQLASWLLLIAVFAILMLLMFVIFAILGAVAAIITEWRYNRAYRRYLATLSDRYGAKYHHGVPTWKPGGGWHRPSLDSRKDKK